LILVFSASQALAIAQAQTQTNDYIITFNEFDVSLIDPGLAYLAGAFPRQLMQRLYFVKARMPLAAERELLAQAGEVSSREAARDAVAAARRKRDTVSLTTMDPFQRDGLLTAAEEGIATAIERLGQSDTTAVVSSPIIVPVRFNESNDATPLPTTANPATGSRLSSLAISVSGSFTQISDWLALRLTVFSHALNQVLLEEVYYCSADDLDYLLASVTRPVATTLLGREYSLVEVRVQPDSAVTSVGNTVIGDNFFLAFDSGTYSFKIGHPRFIAQAVERTLEIGVDDRLEITLAPRQSTTVTIDSAPQGATVLLDTVEAGTTPMELPVGGLSQVVRLDAEGYESQTFVINGAQPGRTYFFTLVPASDLSFSDRFDLTKDGFLNALGLFVCSLPVTILSYGFFSMYYEAQVNASTSYPTGSLSNEEIAAIYTRLESAYFTSQLIFWPSFSGSVLLGIHAAYRLIIYIYSLN